MKIALVVKKLDYLPEEEYIDEQELQRNFLAHDSFYLVEVIVFYSFVEIRIDHFVVFSKGIHAHLLVDVFSREWITKQICPIFYTDVFLNLIGLCVKLSLKLSIDLRGQSQHAF